MLDGKYALHGFPFVGKAAEAEQTLGRIRYDPAFLEDARGLTNGNAKWNRQRHIGEARPRGQLLSAFFEVAFLAFFFFAFFVAFLAFFFPFFVTSFFAATAGALAAAFFLPR